MPLLSRLINRFRRAECWHCGATYLGIWVLDLGGPVTFPLCPPCYDWFCRQADSGKPFTMHRH